MASFLLVSESMRSIDKVVILGANGAMGSGAAAVFASVGISTVMLARTVEKAESGRSRAEQLAKGAIAAGLIECGSYEGLEAAVAGASLILEAVSEDLGTKRAIFARVDAVRAPGTIVSTVSSGLSIAGMCAERSADFRACFLGIHLFNPPTIIRGCELVPHAGTDPGVVAIVRDFLITRCHREVVETADTPAFAGNRLGFMLLNQVAQLAEEHGVAEMDQLVGAHTGRTLAPLATIDLVGWDVHAAIVDNLYASTHDAAHARFALPAYMRRGIAQGLLGRKSGGGFGKQTGKKPNVEKFVLDPKTLAYRPLVPPTPPAFVTAMQAALATGLPAAMDVLCAATEPGAEILREILLGYVSYGLGLVGTVVARPRDIDRIMAFGFAWAPPSVLVDAIGAARTVALLGKHGLPVPAAVEDAARFSRALFVEPGVDRAKFFAAA